MKVAIMQPGYVDVVLDIEHDIENPGERDETPYAEAVIEGRPVRYPDYQRGVAVGQLVERALEGAYPASPHTEVERLYRRVGHLADLLAAALAAGHDAPLGAARAAVADMEDRDLREIEAEVERIASIYRTYA